MAGEVLVLLMVISVDYSLAGITTNSFRRHIFEDDENFSERTFSGNKVNEEIVNYEKQREEKYPKQNGLSSTKSERNKMVRVLDKTTDQTRNIEEGSGNPYTEQPYSVFQTDSLQVDLESFNETVRINYSSPKDKTQPIQCHVVSRQNQHFIETFMDLINCGKFPEIPKGKFIFALGNTPDEISSRVVCHRYYVSVGESSGGLQCRNGTWYHNAICEIVKCPTELPVPSYGQNVSNSGHTVNSTITFSCKYGYELFGNETLLCGEHGNWIGTFPSCHLVKCPKPLLPQHGFINGDDHGNVFNTTLVYQCMKGYTQVGKSDITCQADGKWNRKIPACKPVCLVPNIKGLSKPLWLLPNFKELSDSAEIRFGQQIIFSCKRRYKNAHEGAITCVNGIWLPGIYCIKTSACLNPNIPKHAVVVKQIGKYFVQFACKKGFQISNTDHRVCSRKGTWSRPIPECVKSCKIPKFFAMKKAEFHFEYNKSENRSLNEVFLQYSCKNDYRKLIETQPKCINATWNPMPRCISTIARFSYTYSENIGVAEIFTDGNWGGICDHFYSGIGRWNKSESNVFCRMLGFKGGKKLRAYSTVGVQAKFTGIACSGSETNILQCRIKQVNVFCSKLVVVSCRGYTLFE